jgi:hypothetical protein
MVLIDGMYGHADDDASLATLRHAVDALARIEQLAPAGVAAGSALL